MELFHNRSDAGQQLAKRMRKYSRVSNPLVLALPRGGVPVAFEVAQALRAPLDVFLVRKLGAPGQEELAMGAIASGSVRVVNEAVVERLGVSDATLAAVALQEERELRRREHVYRKDGLPIAIEGRTVFVVDDGLATGSTVRAAVLAIRQKHPAKIIVATPVAALNACLALRDEIDALICLKAPQPFYAVGAWYEDFPQITDEEVCDLLERSGERSHAA